VLDLVQPFVALGGSWTSVGSIGRIKRREACSSTPSGLIGEESVPRRAGWGTDRRIGHDVVTYAQFEALGEFSNVFTFAGLGPQQEAKMVFDKTDTKLSSFIKEASPQDLSLLASQIFTRVGTLEQRQQDQFIQEIRRDPQATRIFEKLQTS
jgi:hypothetical protein